MTPKRLTQGTAAALMAAALMALAACSGEDPNRLAGYIEANLVLVGPEEAGRLDTLAVDEGDRVTKGEDLFTLESKVQEASVAAAQARVNEAKATLEQASKSLDRAKRLVETHVASQSRLDDAQAAFDTARATVAAVQAALDEARTKLDRRKVFAPVTGSVQEVFFRPGEVVSAGQPVVALLPPENLRVRFYVPEPRRATLRLGDSIDVSCDSCPADLTANISFIAREAEYTPPVIFSREERRKLVYLVEARPQGDTVKLTAGQPVTVTLPSGPAVLGP